MSNIYKNKIEIAKVFLRDSQQELETWGENLHEADKKFVGSRLKEEEEKLTKWAKEAQVAVEAFEHYIWELENFLKQDADITKQENEEQKL